MGESSFFVGLIAGVFMALFIVLAFYFFKVDDDKEINIYQQDQMLECTDIDEESMVCSVKK